MRRDRMKINNVVGLREIKEDLRAMLKEHHTMALEALEDAANDMYDEALSMVPVKTGALEESIWIEVSYSRRYPGIIAVASAKNPKTGYDYAPIQEENEEYEHEIGEAHYLETPFRNAVENFYAEMGW